MSQTRRPWKADREWVRWAIATLEADRQRSADTHLIRLTFPEFPLVDIYLKDESSHPSGSLKHRLARSLFLHALCDGAMAEGVTVIEASSGSTAISEAFFARLLGLPFLAVVPESTAAPKVRAIRAVDGQVRLVAPTEDPCAMAAGLAREGKAIFLDQFTNAERATDWRGNNNIAQSLFDQMRLEARPVPAWVVVGAGTGGTSATIGRYIRYRPELAETRLCVVDPDGSAYLSHFQSGENAVSTNYRGLIEGIGRPRIVRSFVPTVIDRMIQIPDPASIAAARWLAERTGRRFGPSTGANLIGVLALASELQARGEAASIVTLGCDGGERYAETIDRDDWLAERGVDPSPWFGRLREFERSGVFDGAMLETADRRF